jgi:hypothetical protein
MAQPREFGELFTCHVTIVSRFPGSPAIASSAQKLVIKQQAYMVGYSQPF